MPNDHESSPGTEPFAPDFDTGEQPARGSEAPVPEADTSPGTEPFAPDFDTCDTGRHSRPQTEPFVPDFDDTGPQSRPVTKPFAPDFDTGRHSRPTTEPFIPDFDTGPQSRPIVTSTSDSEADEESLLAQMTAPAQSVTVPGRYYSLKWWKLAAVILGVWVAAAPIGLGLFFWWYHSVDKTPAVFVVLSYVVACTVAGLILAMVEGRPLVSALALAVMSAPFASVAAAAPLYGYYYCEWMGHCLLGIVPF